MTPLRTLRKGYGYEQQKLAAKVFVSPGYLSDHRGRDRAIPRQAIEDELGPFVDYKDVDRAFRKAYSQLPICSCPDGLFIPQKPAEVVEFKAYLTAKCGPFVAHERAKVIYEARPELIPDCGVQGELF